MNLLECYIIKVLEERPLNQDELNEFKKFFGEEANDFVFVKWEYDCYGSHEIIEEYYPKEKWDSIVKKGYELR